MNSPDILTATEGGNLTLPPDIVEQYQTNKETRFRIVKTQKGVLLVPLTDEQMSHELKAEIDAWQTLTAEGWEQFEYVEPAQ